MSENLIVPTMAEMLAQGKQPEVLFWVGCAGSFDDRAKKITKAFVRILNRANVPFAVLVQKRVVLVIPQKEQEMSSCFKCKR
jgi:Fe-S oxidoreductase